MLDKITEIISHFNIEGKLCGVNAAQAGNINSSYIVETELPDGSKKKYLLQKINTVAFKEPEKIMKNIDLVSRAISIAKTKSGDERKSLEFLTTEDGSNMYVLESENGEKEYYRAYSYITDVVALVHSKDPKIVYQAGRAFGNFQSMIAEVPCDLLEETIPGFHNTDNRYHQFVNDVERDRVGRVNKVLEDIEYIDNYQSLSWAIVEPLEGGLVPYRACHNDTKISNVLLKEDGSDFETVIDLDTIMPGYVGFDYADGVRAAAATASEDESDFDKVKLDMELFKEFTKGYLEEMAKHLTDKEVELLPQSILTITYELSMRFLNDYINGDKYFKTNYSSHNLVRARNQMALLFDMDKKYDEIKEYIDKTYKSFLPEPAKLEKKPVITE